MKKEDAKEAILGEWRALPADQRATGHQAFLFAIEKMKQYRFRCKGDPYQYINGWLQSWVGKP